MFEIKFGDGGEVVLEGRLDASQAPRAKRFFEGVAESRVVNCGGLEYISSAGLGVLLMVQRRLKTNDGGLVLIGLNHHIQDVFRYSGLDRVFDIRKGGG